MAKSDALKWFCCRIVLGFLCFTGFALLIVFGVVFVRPYIHTSHFTEAECRAVSVLDHGKKTCLCTRTSRNDHVKRKCTSEYPCREIIVTFQPEDNAPYHQGRLFPYYNSEFRTALCSVSACHESRVHNQEIIEDFVRKFGNTHHTYGCYYNPSDLDQIVLGIPTSLTVILCMTISSAVVLITGTFLWLLCFCARDKRRDSSEGGNAYELGNLIK